jgi:hypothetical protein
MDKIANEKLMQLIEGCKSGNISMIENAVSYNCWRFFNRLNQNHFNMGLEHACDYGQMNAINKMIELGANDFNWGLRIACLGGHMNAINKMIEMINLNGGLTQREFNQGLLGACEGGHMNAINKMIELAKLRGDLNQFEFNLGLAGACLGGHMNIINKMIEMIKLNGSLNQDDLNIGLSCACSRGHMNAINKMIELGANDFKWDIYGNLIYGNLKKNGYLNVHSFNILGENVFWGLICYCGQMNAINKIIELRKNLNGPMINFNQGLLCACYGGHMNVINKMIDMGATYFNRGLRCACNCGHMDAINKMIEMINLNGVSNKIHFTTGLKTACTPKKLIVSSYPRDEEYMHMKIIEKMLELGGEFTYEGYEKKYKKWKRDKKKYTKIFMDLINRDISLEIVDYL